MLFRKSVIAFKKAKKAVETGDETDFCALTDARNNVSNFYSEALIYFSDGNLRFLTENFLEYLDSVIDHYDVQHKNKFVLREPLDKMKLELGKMHTCMVELIDSENLSLHKEHRRPEDFICLSERAFREKGLRKDQINQVLLSVSSLSGRSRTQGLLTVLS
jgi:hypothetical protein